MFDQTQLKVHVSIQILPDGGETFRFQVGEDDSLLDLMVEGADLASTALLPTGDNPLDELHNLRGQDVGPTINDLDQAVGPFVRAPQNTQHFGITLVRAFRVNTRWAVAPQAQLSPREILSLAAINLDYTQFTLYLPDSSEPLPLDEAIPIERGDVFEAQRDGKYGMEG